MVTIKDYGWLSAMLLNQLGICKRLKNLVIPCKSQNWLSIIEEVSCKPNWISLLMFHSLSTFLENIQLILVLRKSGTKLGSHHTNSKFLFLTIEYQVPNFYFWRENLKLSCIDSQSVFNSIVTFRKVTITKSFTILSHWRKFWNYKL